MQFPPGVPDPSEHELRLRATMRVARRRSFMVSAVVVGSLIVLNLFFYARTRNTMWLLLDAVFACTLSYRAWAAFGADRKDDQRIERGRSDASGRVELTDRVAGYGVSAAPCSSTASAGFAAPRSSSRASDRAELLPAFGSLVGVLEFLSRVS